MARTLVASAESSYGIHASEGKVQAARDLLSNDAYHFGKTAAVSTQTANKMPFAEPQLLHIRVPLILLLRPNT
jgi:hypothetical protein